MMVQRSSGVLLPPPASRSIHDTGSRRSARYQNTRSPLPMLFMKSSTNTMPGRSSSLALARNGRAATMWVMPALSIAACIASGPMVKLRLTGTLPASSSAMFASAAPTDAGSSTPTLRLAGGSAWSSLRASRNAPVSAWPKVTVWPERIRHREAAPGMLGLRREAAVHQVDLLAPVAEGIAAHLQQLLPHVPGARRRRQRLPERDGDRIEEPRRPFPEELAFLEAEDAAPHLVEMHRDDRHLEPVDDLLEAALERQHVAGAADRALGEDADHVARLQFLARPLDRAERAARPAAAGRDRAHQGEQLAQHRHLEERRVDHEAHEALHAGADQQAVDEGEMVGDQQRRPVQRHVIRVHDADAVDAVRQHPQAEADQEVRQQDQQVGNDRERRQARQRRNQVGRCMDESRQHHGAGGQQDPGSVHHVVGGDQLAALVLVGLLLEHGVERHAVEAAEESEQGEAGHGRGIAALDRRQRQRAAGDADSADRHQAKLHLVPGEPPGGQAADSDADGDRGTEQADRHTVGRGNAQRLDREYREQLLHQRADEPEIAEAQHRQPQATIAVENAQAAARWCRPGSTRSARPARPGGVRPMPNAQAVPTMAITSSMTPMTGIMSWNA